MEKFEHNMNVQEDLKAKDLGEVVENKSYVKRLGLSGIKRLFSSHDKNINKPTDLEKQEEKMMEEQLNELLKRAEVETENNPDFKKES